jgi:hypothetical protein
MTNLSLFTRISLGVVFLLAAACGGSSSTVDPLGPDGGAPGASSGGSGTGTEDPGGPRLTLALRGSTAPVVHDDGLAGQTPSHQIVAIKSFWLYRSPTDPRPVKVLDLAKSVETDFIAEKAVDVGSVAFKSLPAGTYTFAKVGTAYVRYSVAARMHATVTADGRYDNTQALSDGAVIDGQTRAKGWYHFAFSVGGMTYGALEGSDAPLPKVPMAGAIALETVGSESFYTFPTSVVIDPDQPADQRWVMDVNVHESFRWVDQAQPGYATNVYDTTPTSFEPVMAFGANSFSLSLEAK